MAITIDIDTARPYQVHVGTFLLEQAGPLVRATAGGTRAVIVTDTNVGPLYQVPVKQSLESAGYEVSICTFEAGEAHKRAETYVAILEFVAEHELSRSDVIVALGGGVVGDVVMDLAVGLQIPFIKNGCPRSGERIDKLNFLMRVKDNYPGCHMAKIDDIVRF